MGLSYADTPVMKVCDGLNDDEIPGAARLPRKKALEWNLQTRKSMNIRHVVSHVVSSSWSNCGVESLVLVLP